jgi:hypothetical protein
MNDMRLSRMASALTIALVMAAPTTVSADNRVDLRANLTATSRNDPFASGDAEFESSSYDTQFDVRVREITSTDMVVVEFTRNGVETTVGFIMLDQYGDGELQLDRRNGDNVPQLQAGDVITVEDAATGEILLQGTLQQRR